MPFDLQPPPTLLTFDCYGTLIDWDTALQRYVTNLLTQKGLGISAGQFYGLWYREYALPALRGPFQLYRDLLRTSLQQTLRAVGAPVDPADGADAGDAMAAAEPFPDTVEVLHQIAPHYSLATISNSQNDILAHSLARLHHVFSWSFTAETTRAYKPDPALFELVLREAGVSPQRTVHIAQSQHVDLPRSISMGIRTVWINRHHQQLGPDTPAPDAELPDLQGVPTLLGMASPSTL